MAHAQPVEITYNAEPASHKPRGLCSLLLSGPDSEDMASLKFKKRPRLSTIREYRYET